MQKIGTSSKAMVVCGGFYNLRICRSKSDLDSRRAEDLDAHRPSHSRKRRTLFLFFFFPHGVEQTRREDSTLNLTIQAGISVRPIGNHTKASSVNPEYQRGLSGAR